MSNPKIASAIYKPLTISMAVGVLVTLLSFVALSFVMTWRDIPHSMIEPLALACVGLGSFSSGFLAAKILRTKGLLVGAGCGLILFVFIAVLGLTLGSIGLDLNLAIKFVIILLSSSIGGVIGVNTKAIA